MDILCKPACTPVPVNTLPVAPPPAGCNTALVVLCAPGTGDPVFVYVKPDGTNLAVSAFNSDGTPYAGDLADLENCGGGGGGGGLTSVATLDTFSIDLSGAGTLASRLQASVRIDDTAAGNMLVEGPNGLSVGREVPNGGLMNQVLGKLSNADQDIGWITPTGGGAGSVAVADTPTVDLQGNGEVGTPITAQVKISADVGNAVEARADGLFLPPGEKGDKGDSVVPNEWGVLTDAKIAAIQAADVDWVFSVVYTDTDGVTPGDQRADLNVPASLTGNKSGHLIRYDASDNAFTDLGPFAGVPGPVGPGVPAGGAPGQILAKASGVDHATQWINPPAASVTSADTNTIDLAGAGTVGSPLTAAAKISSDANNHLSATPTGLFTPREVPPGGTTNQVLAKASNADSDLAWVTPTTGLMTVTSSDSQTIDFSGDGTSGSALTASVVLDSTTNAGIDQLLTAGANGLKVSSLQQFVVKNLAASALVVSDTGKYLNFTATTAKSITVPLNATAAIPIGATMHLFNEGTGTLTIVPETGAVDIKKSADQTFDLIPGKGASLTKYGTNTWHLVGGMEAA